MARIPYTTKAGVQIGILYEPPRDYMSREAELVQRAYLPKCRRPVAPGVPRWYPRTLAVASVLLALIALFPAKLNPEILQPLKGKCNASVSH